MITTVSNGQAVELVGLTKRYGRSTVVNDVSLTIPRGSIFGLLGLNGAGKSTTIKMMMGMIPITAGKARVLGVRRSGRSDPRQAAGWVCA